MAVTETDVTPPPTLEFVDVTYGYAGDEPVLRDFSLEVSCNQTVSLIGPSGCGKSTVLRLAAGLDAPGSGLLTCATESVAQVFQRPNLLPWRTALENVRLPLELQGDCKDMDRLASEALRAVGLGREGDKRPRKLSLGMQMRVAVARALVARPELVLLDEPFAAVDEITRWRLNVDLQHRWSERPFAALYVTHSVAEAVFFGGAVVVMGARSGTVEARFAVPFAFPRTPDLRSSPEFVRLVRDIEESLNATSTTIGFGSP